MCPALDRWSVLDMLRAGKLYRLTASEHWMRALLGNSSVPVVCSNFGVDKIFSSCTVEGPNRPLKWYCDCGTGGCRLYLLIYCFVEFLRMGGGITILFALVTLFLAIIIGHLKNRNFFHLPELRPISVD